MKKVIFWILSILFVSPLFVNWDILWIVDIVDSTWENVYYELTDMCNQYTSTTPKNIISYWFWKYTDLDSFSFYDINWNSVSSVDPCSITDNPWIYVYWLNNWYFTDSSWNSVFLWSLVTTGLSYYPFTFAFNFSYWLNSDSVFNWNLYLKLPVWNNYNFRNSYYITINWDNNNSSVVDLSNWWYSTYRFVRLYIEYNILNFWNSSSFITNFGSVVDVPGWCSRILYTTLSDWWYSSILNCSWDLQFKTIAWSDINYTIYDEFSSVDVLDNNRDYLFLHFNNYSSDYLSWKLSIIVKNTSSWLIYNIYPFVNSVNQLSWVDPLRKWYLIWSFYSYSLSNSTELPYFFDSYWSYNNWLNIRSYNRWKYYFSSSLWTIYPYISSTSTLTFNEDNSVPKINLIWDNWSNSLTTWKVEELIDIYCNQLHLINPALCNNNWGPSIWSWAYTYEPVLSWDQVVLVITDYSDTNNYIIHTWEDWEIWIECVWDWCPIYNNTWSSDIWSVWGSGFILDTWYYENFFNKTWYFAKCPYPYTDLQIWEKLKIVQKIKNSIGDFDIFLPINCSIAAFTAWKTYKFLSDIDMWLNPLMWNIQNSEDLRVYLYRFFDFLMSFALIVFLLKIYHLLN